MNTTSKYFTRIKTFSCDEYTADTVEDKVNSFIEKLEIPKYTSIKLNYHTSGTGAGTDCRGTHRLFIIVEYKRENPDFIPPKRRDEDEEEDGK